MANNLEADSTYIYDRSAPVGGADPLPAIIPTGTIFVATVNGATGAVSFSGTTGLTFTGAGSTVTVAGTLAVANGGTGATNVSDARTNLVAAKSGVNTDITQLNGASQVDVTGEYKIGGNKVVGARGAAITDADGTLAGATTAINAILAQMRLDGKIAT